MRRYSASPTIRLSLRVAAQWVESLGCGSVAYNFAVHNREPVAYYSVGAYFQDEYRVNSKLKLTLTLRADRNSGGACHKVAPRSTAAFDALPHGDTIPYARSFLTGNETIIPGVEKVVFEPRFGLAWCPSVKTP